MIAGADGLVDGRLDARFAAVCSPRLRRHVVVLTDRAVDRERYGDVNVARVLDGDVVLLCVAAAGKTA